jgi:hypothetical protein
MLVRFGLAAAFAALSLAPAFAEDAACTVPIPPVAIDGAVATQEQMNAMHDDVVNFIKASDDYQNCVIADLNAKKEKAHKMKIEFDPYVQKEDEGLIAANQRLKEKVGGEFNAAVQAFKGHHISG